MKTEQSIEKVFEALAVIRNDLDQQSRSLNEQIRQTQLQYLENSFEEQKGALADCIDGIDQQLMKLAVYVDEYQCFYAMLNELNGKISALGGTPRAMPEALAGDGLTAILSARIDHLKSLSKI